jgi:hypothetical protein
MTGLLGPAGGRKAALGELLAAGEMVLAPGCYDALGRGWWRKQGSPPCT